MHYFAIDGNYGDASRMVVLDTSDWLEEDWTEIDECLDYERVERALDISYRVKNRKLSYRA